MSPQTENNIEGSPAGIYDQSMVPAVFGPWTEDFVEFVAPRLGESALDIACGTGAPTRRMAAPIGSDGGIVGLDFDFGMIDVARCARSDIESHEANALQMPFGAEEFDIAASHQGFQFLPDREAGLMEIRRVSRPRGRLALAVWRSIEYSPGHHAWSKALEKWVNPDVAKLVPFSLGGLDILRGFVGDAGFENIDARAVSKVVHLEAHYLAAEKL